MSLLDPQTLRYIEVNDAAVRLFEAPDRESMRDASPTERWPVRQPDGRLSIEKARAIIKVALEQGTHRFEWYAQRYDGTERPLDIVITAIPFAGRTLLSLVYRDISDHKRAETKFLQLNASLEKRVAERTAELTRSEEKFRALFEGTSQPVFLHDPYRIVDANPSWLRFHGYASREEVIGINPMELAAPIQPCGERAEALAKKHLAHALAYGSARFEWMVIRRDGTEVPMEVFLAPVQVGDRQLFQNFCNEINREPHMLVVGMDITQRKQAEAELRESEARLRESEERFSKAFLANPVQLSIMRARDKKFIEVNDALVQWMGLDRDKIIGRDSVELGMWVNRDQGIGIPEADTEWLFSPFHRGRNVHDRPGTGLGLVIVKRCVDLHGGTIQVLSKCGEGTVVSVRLPNERDPGSSR